VGSGERKGAGAPVWEAAWLALVPAAVLVVLAELWVAPPLADVLYGKSSLRFLPFAEIFLAPEHVEDTRYLLAIAAPPLLAAFVLYAPRRAFGLRRGSRERRDVLLIVIQGAAMFFLIVCVAKQRDAPLYQHSDRGYDAQIFRTWQFALAAAAAPVLTALLLRRGGPPRIVDRVRHALEHRRWIAPAIAASVTICMLLPAVYTGSALLEAGPSVPAVPAHLPFSLSDYAAALNGRTPFTDFVPFYATLLPLAAEPLFSLTGLSIGAFTATMTALSAVALLAVYATFRLVSRDRLTALVLYLPFLGLSLIPIAHVGGETFFSADHYAFFPDRYLLTYLTALLCARSLRYGSQRVWPVFFIAALAALNNMEFGLPTAAAAALALWIGSDSPLGDRRRLREIGVQLLAGVALAAALVSAVVLIRSGSLPDFIEVLHQPRLYVDSGFYFLPMPVLGLHIVVYLTYAAAILVSAVSARERSGDPVLRGMLAFIGVLGLGAGSYYAGISAPVHLTVLLSLWGFAVSLLALAAARSLRARRFDPFEARLALIPGLVVLAGLALMATTLVHLPAPWTQVKRITRSGPDYPDLGSGVRFISEHTEPGEAVAIHDTFSYTEAEEAGVTDTAPVYFVVTYEHLDRELDQLEDAGGDKVFTAIPLINARDVAGYLKQHGYGVTAFDPHSQLLLWQRQATPPASAAEPPNGAPAR
jgi:hypothetical protein